MGEIFFSNTNYLTCQATSFEDNLNCIDVHIFLFFKRFTYSNLLLLQQQLRTSKSIPTTKVVVTFCLRLRNKFQSFPTKNQASDWLTQQGLVFIRNWLELITQSQIKGDCNFSIVAFN